MPSRQRSQVPLFIVIQSFPELYEIQCVRYTHVYVILPRRAAKLTHRVWLNLSIARSNCISCVSLCLPLSFVHTFSFCLSHRRKTTDVTPLNIARTIAIAVLVDRLSAIDDRGVSISLGCRYSPKSMHFCIFRFTYLYFAFQFHDWRCN